ncbi:MAG: hypothetical protein RLZZ543_720, partial [Bacteroidota bacterium]
HLIPKWLLASVAKSLFPAEDSSKPCASLIEAGMP